MPTENERKFLIKSDCEKDIASIANKTYRISQGYLIATRGITVRVRKSFQVETQNENFYFTLKVNTAGRVVEIENKIDKRDFEDLWNIALNKLEKIRYAVNFSKDIWEIDFFKDYKNQTYIAIAEIEMPEGRIEPEVIPDFIYKNTIYKVPLTDARFSNKLLGDARYASKLLEEILKLKK